MKKVCFYGCKEEIVYGYKLICNKHNIEVIALSDNDLSKTLEVVFEDRDFHFQDNEEFNEMFMLMNGIDRELMMKLLDEFKDEGIPFGGIKIMKTVHNYNWKVRNLFEEVVKEHEIFKKNEILRQMIVAANDINKVKLSHEQVTKMNEVLLQGYMVMQTNEKNIEQIDASINNILSFLKDIK